MPAPRGRNSYHPLLFSLGMAVSQPSPLGSVLAAFASLVLHRSANKHASFSVSLPFRRRGVTSLRPRSCLTAVAVLRRTPFSCGASFSLRRQEKTPRRKPPDPTSYLPLRFGLTSWRENLSRGEIAVQVVSPSASVHATWTCIAPFLPSPTMNPTMNPTLPRQRDQTPTKTRHTPVPQSTLMV